MRKLMVLLLVAVPVFATEPNPSPKQRELVEKFLAATDSDATGKRMMDAMLAQFEKAFQGESDDEIENRETFKMFRERVAKLDLMKAFHEEQIRLYAKYFDEKELTDLVNFYSSPTGKKVVDVLPNLLRESMQMASEKLGPQFARLAEEVKQDYEKARPWRGTMKNIRVIATALEAYATDNEGNYPTGNIDAIKKVLVPTYLKEFPEHDMWGKPYAYAVSDDRKHYRVVSSGADTNFEWDSLRPVALPESFQTKWTNRLEDDLIYADGEYFQMPVQAKPKNDN